MGGILMAMQPLNVSAMKSEGMTEKEWREGLKGLGLNASEAALLINLRTAAAINPQDTVRQFRRKTNGTLSQRETAMWRLFFRYYRKPRNQRHATA